jgi:hypothetical protein
MIALMICAILRRLVPAVTATGVDRVRYMAFMERVDHFPLWLIPRKNDSELRGPAYIAQQFPLAATFSEAEGMAQRIKVGFETSKRGSHVMPFRNMRKRAFHLGTSCVETSWLHA